MAVDNAGEPSPRTAQATTGLRPAQGSPDKEQPGNKKIGLLGGSFDPIHHAHIALANAALRELKLAQVQLIPAADPWQRAPLSATPAQRQDMLALAIQAHPGLRINPIELLRGGPSYTIDTLQALPGEADYFWLLGSDQLNNFCSWHRWQDIARLVTLVVASRPDAPLQPPAALQAHLDSLGRPLLHLPFTPMPVSATAIRHALQHGQPVDTWLDHAVLQYIRDKGLYLPASPPSPAL